jgi:GNAT superfamily N-acetyltransferase
MDAVTLTTFCDVPWNAPWYARLGFRVLRDGDVTAGVARRRNEEHVHGLPRELRVVMQRDVVPAIGKDALFRRNVATLLASWEAYASTSPTAEVHRLDGVVAAVFPDGPEGDIYNNAVLEFGLSARDRAAALDAMASVYAAAGVSTFAAWVPEADEALRQDVEARGYEFDSSTCVMSMSLGAITTPRPELDDDRVAWDEYLRVFELAPDLLAGVDHEQFHLRGARLDGDVVSAAWAFDHDGDCGIFNVGTVPPARRRGLGAAVTALQLYEGRDRGCWTASLQATPIAERVYRAVGFRDLGRFLEYVPR